MRDYIFPPLIFPLFLILIFFPFLLLIFFLTTPKVFQILFGLSYSQALTVFFMIVIGSFINIPLVEKEGKEVVREYNFFGIIYQVRQRSKMTVAVNLGGCIFPSLIAVKLLLSLPLTPWIIAFILTSIIIYFNAKPVRGVGIAVPMFLPPLISVLTSYFIISFFGLDMYLLPKFAYAVGVLAVLFGADILHLKDLEKIGSGVISIGGAGTFDGIFLTGIFSVILSVLLF
ncbi:putative membrane protein [Archaeoglobus sulfaticallidus PM70-1]|uniref:Putative membrane protein n=1 Tax=Archaeoglobus sulfaticallidus PM70-1 TaxID=387631 RepID=N0BGK6_9EURY|nr:DUF1614 domain-containing protein [Archaeoglobus sulfaticallidus]AGK62138.1 putative membrane protein [Archaeoglobus sulfaticallidus PM70-1]